MSQQNYMTINTCVSQQPINGVQLQWSADRKRCNYILLNSYLYAIGSMNSMQIQALWNDLACNGVSTLAVAPKREKAELTEFLAEQGLTTADIVNFQAKKKAEAEAVKRERAERGRGQQDLFKDEDDGFVTDTLTDDSIYDDEFHLIKVSPSVIVQKRLYALQQEGQPLYVEQPVKLVHWYYSNFDTVTRELIDDLETVHWDNMFNKLIKISMDRYTSIEVMREVMQAYCNFYKIDRKIDTADVLRMGKILEKIGV